MKPYAYLLSLIICSLCICSCSNENDVLPEATPSELKVYCVQSLLPDREENSSILFTGDDIEWFDPSTREIKFNGIKPNPSKISGGATLEFRIGEQPLFSRIHFVSSINSQAFLDMVLYYDLIADKYYLDDCYPNTKAMRETPEVKQHISEREAQWQPFIEALKAEGKLID